MSGYTKGPWVISKHGRLQGANGRDVGVSGMGITIQHYEDIEGEANAHLIAAAPMMYEALKEAHAFIADQYADAESQALDGEYVSREARPLWDTICNAMAKAEGE